jgi:hypothetical protein
MFSNATLPEIPIPSQKPQEILTKNAHNNLADDDLNHFQTVDGRRRRDQGISDSYSMCVLLLHIEQIVVYSGVLYSTSTSLLYSLLDS